MKSRLLRVIALFALVFALITIGGPAMAAEQVTAVQSLSASAPSAVALPMADPDANLDPVEIETGGNINIPSSRWQEGSNQFHGRYDQFLQSDPVAMASRTLIQTMGMSAGNGAYTLTQGVLGLAMVMEPLNLIGYEADKAVAALGTALTGNAALLAVFVVVVVGSAIFMMIRANGQKPWKKLLGAASIIALIVIMTIGAGKSTEDGKGNFQPGLGSPGWVATKINASITAIASAPAKAMTLDAAAASTAAYPGSSCDTQMKNMATRYGYTANPAGSITQIVSQMWETSGLTVWKATQYGASESVATNNHGDNVFCHQLDWQADIKPGTQASAYFGSLSQAVAAKYDPKSTAWGADDNDVRDRSLIAWAACNVDQNGTATVRANWAPVGPIDNGDCHTWFHGGQSASLDAFNISGKASDISGKTDDDSIITFVQTLHGNDVSGGMLLVYAYSFSAILTFIVFGGLGLAIAIAKLAGVVMIFALFFVFLASLATGNAGGSKVMQFLKLYIGYAVFAFGSMLILTIVVMLSRLVAGLGVSIFGGLMGVMWTGISPLLACWLLAMIFKKIFKLPSVFAPSSALAWGGAAGAVGAAGAGALGRMERRAGGAAAGASRVAGRKLGNYALGRVSGGRNGRKGAMAPGGAGGALGGALGAAAGTMAGEQLNNHVKGKTHRDGSPKIDRKTLRDARRFDNGIDPTAPYAGLRDVGAQFANAGRNISLDSKFVAAGIATGWNKAKTWKGSVLPAGGIKDAVHASRARRLDLLGPASRNGIRANGAAAVEPQRSAIASAAARARLVGKNSREYASMIAKNPGMAAGLLTERAGNSMKAAVSGTIKRVGDTGTAAWNSDIRKEPLLAAGMAAESAGKALNSGMRSAVQATGSGVRSAARAGYEGSKVAAGAVRTSMENPTARAFAGTAARMGTGALIGGVLGGPAGVIAGGAVGLTRSRKAFSKIERDKETALVNNYTAHLEAQKKTAEAPKTQDAPAGAGIPMPAAQTQPKTQTQSKTYRVQGTRPRAARPTKS